MGVGNNVGMIVAALVGGLIGAVVLVLAYFVGIALVGAGLGALIAHEVWYWIKPGDPPVLIVIGAALAGAVGGDGRAALRDRRRHGVRRCVDDDRRRDECAVDERSDSRVVGDRSVDSVSDSRRPASGGRRWRGWCSG